MQLVKKGLDFVCVVKTATKRLLMKPLQQTILPKIGTQTYLLQLKELSCCSMFGPILIVIILF